jgi:hypothetical protein
MNVRARIHAIIVANNGHTVLISFDWSQDRDLISRIPAPEARVPTAV